MNIQNYRKLILYGALGIIIFMLMQAWQKQEAKTEKKQQQTLSVKHSATHSAVPTVAPVTAAKTTAGASSAVPSVVPTTGTAAEKKTIETQGKLIQVHTDVLDVAIATKGGNIVSARLPKYPTAIETPDIATKVLQDSPDGYYVAQSGLTGAQGPDTAKGQVTYTASQQDYTLENGQKELKVTLNWQNPQGLKVAKTFTFHPDSYAIHISYKINNQSAKTWAGHFYGQLRHKPVSKRSIFQIHSYEGGAISSPAEHYQKVSYKDMQAEPLDQNIKGGWLAMQQRYFLTAWIPENQALNHYYSSGDGKGIYTLGYLGPAITVAPGKTATTSAKLYVGPEKGDRLKAVAPFLKLTIDYGWLWFIAIILFWMLKEVHVVVGNWGWSIVGVTLIIKACFAFLSTKAYKSMAKMRKLQPQLLAIKERCGDDKQKLSKATMEMYKKHKANPLGGCLPILVQIPVFIALYYVLTESVALRQAPFIFWIHDLSVKDPYYVLPILMGISMFIQQKLSPPPPDPTQAKVMMFLPVVMTLFFLHFPAGLVLYWLVNNVVNVLHQWYIMRKYG